MSKRPLRAAPLIDPFAVDFCGSEATLRDGLRQVMHRLDPLALDLCEAGTVEVILAEALNNIVEHAIEQDTPDTRIRVQCTPAADGLNMVIIDRGRPMPDGKAPCPTQPDVNVPIADLPEGGFGWFMIHTLARDIRYRRVGSANHLNLRIPVGT